MRISVKSSIWKMKLKKRVLLGVFAFILMFIGSQSGLEPHLDVQDAIDKNSQPVQNPSASVEYNYEEGSIVIDASMSVNTSTSGNWTWAVGTFDWCTGSGTWGDPYIIEGVHFDGGGINHGLSILNSRNDYFEIRNCKSNSSTTLGKAGIYLDSTSNGTLYNNNCSLNYYGISLRSSSDNNTVTGNNCSYNDYGFYLYSSSNNTVTGNNCSYSDWGGIYLSSSSNNTVTGNNCSYNIYSIYLDSSSDNTLAGNNCLYNYYGFDLDSSSDNTLAGNNCSYNTYGIDLHSSSDNTLAGNNCSYNTYGIDLHSSSDNNTLTGNEMNECGLVIQNSINNNVETTNLVNNKPVYYYENAENLIINGEVIGNVGQLIMVNCNDSEILNLDVSYSSIGIYLENCKNSNLTGNNCSYNTYGIRLYSSPNNSITGNNYSYNTYGIYLESSFNNTLTGNNCSYNNVVGISLYASSDNTLSGNNCSYNMIGINLNENSDENTIWMNYVSDNSWSQAYTSISNSNWDNGTIGNYWGDFEERYPDAESSNGLWWDWEYQIHTTKNYNDTRPLVHMVEISFNTPDSPTITTLSQTINNESITMQWTEVDGADSYNIYVNGTLNGTSSTNEKLVTLLVNGMYKITVTAVNTSGESAESNKITIEVEYLSVMVEFNYRVDSVVIDASMSTNTTYSGNWTWVANTFDWCTGSGTWGDPYVIEGVFFDGGGINHGLSILNSRNDYFEIRNCKSNSSTTLGKAGIYLDSTSNGTLYNNNCSLNYYGIYLSSSSDNTVTGNNCSYNIYWAGIFLQYSSDNTVTGNNCSYNYYDGIYLYYSSNNTLTGNNCSYNIDYGIYSSSSSNNTLMGNNCSYNSDGIYLGSSSDNNTLTGNNCSYNSDDGIYLDYSSNSTLTGNNASFNKIGIILGDNADENIIWMNYISNNSVSQADTISSNSNWDNGTIGNYWGDFEERYPDAESSNGIWWDWEYQINGTNYNDTRPLVYMVEIHLTPPNSPTIITLNQTINNDSVTVQWMEVDGADSYNIYVNGTLNGTSSTNEKLILLHVNGIYGIIVTAINASGESAESNEITITVNIPPDVMNSPVPPTIITLTQTINNDSITMQWTEVEGVDSYIIYVNGILNGTSSINEKLVTFDVNGTYKITVTAVNASGESTESNEITIVVEIPPSMMNSPDSPTIITLSKTINSDSITVQWTEVEDADSYNIYVDGELSESSVTNEKVVVFHGKGTYIITVTAVNEIGESEESDSITIIVEIPPGEENEEFEIPGYPILFTVSMMAAAILISCWIVKRKSKGFQIVNFLDK